MKFLFRLIRNNLFPLAFLLLFGISLSQVLRFNLYQQSFYFNSSKAAFSKAAQLQNSWKEYFILMDVNEKLVQENLRLRTNNPQNTMNQDSTVVLVRDTNGLNRYSYQKALVIKGNTRLRNNFVTIDKGKIHGIKKGMAVIAPSGIVGLVYDVANNFSLVLTVLNGKFVTTPMIPAIGFREGSITWNGLDPEIVQLNNVDKFKDVKPGMEVLTSNYAVKFPSGIPIGTIKTVKKKATSSFFEINVKLAVDFRKLGYVYVVTDNYKAQLDSFQIKEDFLNVP